MQNLTEREKVLCTFHYPLNKLEPSKKTKKEMDLVKALAKAEGNLKFLAEVSSSSDWQGSMTQGEAILNALNFVQEASQLNTEIRYSK